MTVIELDQPVRKRAKLDLASPFIYALALIVVGITIVPVLYVIIGGFRTNADLARDPAGWPDPWSAQKYLDVLFGEDSLFWSQALSSTIIALGTTLGVVLVGVMAAFLIARYEFRGRRGLYSLFTAGLLFPISVAILPLSIMLQTLDLNGTLWGVVIPQVAFALPTTIIILVPFLRAIPIELEDPALIDGASRIGFFWRILLPLSGPGLVTVGVLTFVASWNAYLLPLFVLGAGGAPRENYTLPLGTQVFATQFSQDTAGVLAYTSLAMLPALIFFTLLERRIVGGLTGAVKG
jgi:raffinose/stachyose/melibiose transport system permease protein